MLAGMCRNEWPCSECQSNQKDGYVDGVFGDTLCHILAINIHTNEFLITRRLNSGEDVMFILHIPR
jgi:hypothetical protein